MEPGRKARNPNIETRNRPREQDQSVHQAAGHAASVPLAEPSAQSARMIPPRGGYSKKEGARRGRPDPAQGVVEFAHGLVGVPPVPLPGGPLADVLGQTPDPRLRQAGAQVGTARHGRVAPADARPQTARPGPRGLPVGGGMVLHRRGVPCCPRSPCACMPSPLPRRSRWVVSLDGPSDISLPQVSGGSASTSPVSGPAQRSLRVTACMLAKSP